MCLFKIKSSDLQKAYADGMDEYISLVVDSINEGIGGKLDSNTMPKLNADQITLLAYSFMHEEVMDGGFVQLIYNGYGPFVFLNPFAKALKNWGLDDLASLVKKGGKLYRKHHKEIEIECSDEDFMALFERYPDFDALDDTFVENEEVWTREVAEYVKKNIVHFVEVEND